MAVHPNPDVSAATHQKFVAGPVTDAVLKATPFLNEVKKRGNIKYGVGGTEYQPPPIRKGQMPIGPWTGYNIGIVPEPQLFATPSFPFTGYISQWVFLEWNRLANQEGNTRIADMYAEYLKAEKGDWAVYFNSLFFSDGSTATPAGLLGLPSFMKASGTYGGLNQSNAWWQPVRLDGSTGLANRTFATDPLAYLERLMNNIAQLGASTGVAIDNRPDFGMTTQTMFEHLKMTFANRTYQAATVNTESVGMNFINVMAVGATIYWDPGCTANTLYVLRLDDAELVFQTEKMFGTKTYYQEQPIGEAHQTFTKGNFVYRDVRSAGMLYNSGV